MVPHNDDAFDGVIREHARLPRIDGERLDKIYLGAILGKRMDDLTQDEKVWYDTLRADVEAAGRRGEIVDIRE